MATHPRAEDPRALSETTRSVRGLLGSLIAVPLAAFFFGSQWSCDERLEPPTARIVSEVGPSATREAPLRWRAEETDSEGAARLRPREAADIALPRPLEEFSIELQAEAASSYQVSASREGGGFDLVWTALGAPEATGLTTRLSPPLRLAAPANSLRITPLVRREPTSISALRLIAPRWSLPHLALAPLPWIVWCGLWAAGRRPSAARAAGQTLEAWQRTDLWIAAVVMYLILFRVTAPGLAGAAAAAAILVTIFCLRRAPIATASTLVGVAICAVIVSKALTAIVVAAVAEQFDLTVDHRLKPDGRDINSDGIRFRGEADDVKEEDFAVLFLGDSFTFGTRLRNRTTYPDAFATFLNSRECPTTVRAINFGWPSASPLLSLRLLRQIGHKYKPDLVVYNLDMTDFHDDLRYERTLQSAGELEIDSARLLQQFVDRRLPWLSVDLAGATGLRGLLRPGRPREIGGEPEMPSDRFFATKYPLEETRTWIESGVMKNLAAIHEFAADTLEAPMVLVLYPRAYQYSDRESPKNWEGRAYETLGPFVREPFRYFDEVAARLPYPSVNLLPAFELSKTFPLYFEDDPHWNRDGARLAGRAAAQAIGGLGLIPCANP
jgi:hypothetical protein